jgi:hypothetical protein
MKDRGRADGCPARAHIEAPFRAFLDNKKIKNSGKTSLQPSRERPTL